MRAHQPPTKRCHTLILFYLWIDIDRMRSGVRRARSVHESVTLIHPGAEQRRALLNELAASSAATDALSPLSAAPPAWAR